MDSKLLETDRTVAGCPAPPSVKRERGHEEEHERGQEEVDVVPAGGILVSLTRLEVLVALSRLDVLVAANADCSELVGRFLIGPSANCFELVSAWEPCAQLALSVGASTAVVVLAAVARRTAVVL